jgi:hypothetical protein
MDQFVRRENVERFRLMVEQIIADKTERQRSLKLFSQERHKQKKAGSLWTEALSHVGAAGNIREREQ